MNYPLKYRRARALVYATLLFWLWAWLGSGFFIASLFDSPVYALLAMYALTVAILVSLPVMLLSAAAMVLYRSKPVIGTPTASTTPGEVRAAAAVADLDARRAPGPTPHPHADWWFSDKAS